MRSPRRRPARAAGPPRSTDVTTRLKGFDEAPVLAPHQPCQGGAPPIPVASSTSATWTSAARAQIARSTRRHAMPSHGRVLTDVLEIPKFFTRCNRFPALKITPGLWTTKLNQNAALRRRLPDVKLINVALRLRHGLYARSASARSEASNASFDGYQSARPDGMRSKRCQTGQSKSMPRSRSASIGCAV